MPQTPPAHFVVPRKLTDTELAQAIRLDIEAELDAINLYQSHIDATDNELAKKVLAHIRDEEREHASMFWALLKQLDPKVAEEDASAGVKVRLIGQGADEASLEAALEKRENGGESGTSDAEATSIQPASVMRQFTVGSLRTRR